MTSQTLTNRMSAHVAPRMRNLIRQRSSSVLTRRRTRRQGCLRRMSTTASATSSPSQRISAGNLSLTDFRTIGADTTKKERIFSSLASPSPSSAPTEEDTLFLDNDPAILQGMNRQELTALASQQPTPLRLADMYKYGASTDSAQRLRNAQFLHQELQIRIAQRAVDLLTLPHGLSEATPIKHVATMYLEYLRKFQDMPVPVTDEQEDAFTDMLQGLVLDRTSIPMDIARGVVAWRDGGHTAELEAERLQEMEDALYRFFTARVGLRFLTEHHVLSSPRESTRALRKVTHLFPPEPEDRMTGCIQANCDLVKDVNQVSALVSQQTEEYYGMCPEINIVDCIHDASDFTYVPHHLQYMLGELLKNSCRATVRHAMDQEWTQGQKQELPPIRVILVKGEEDVTIKIADKGGGIPRSLMATVFKFAHSTADEKESETDFGIVEATGGKIRGFGLPLARIYAQYFGGELTLKSTEGYGLDTYLHLPRLGDSCEHLPLRVRSSPGEGVSMPPLQQTRAFSTLARRNKPYGL